MMTINNYEYAAEILQSLIERNPIAVDTFIGLGSKEEMIGFS
jgi:hypothetical protein